MLKSIGFEERSYTYKKKEITRTPQSMNIMTLGLPKLFVAYKPMRRPVIPEWMSVSTDKWRVNERKYG